MPIIPAETPLPFEWHPRYAAHVDALLKWLMDENASLCYRVPRSMRMVASFDPEPVETSRSFDMLTRMRCVGLAPYVGEPFVYRWNVGIDDLGRAVATDSWIHYLPKGQVHWCRSDICYQSAKEIG
jgi:hypothetical protein